MSEVIARAGKTARGTVSWLEAGAGWPVIVLHAFPFDAAMWRPQLDRVPASWRFIAPDLRGFGRTPLGSAVPSIDTYALDTLALMDALEIESAIVGGLSMGGYVTFAMHRLEPGRFTGMILADTRSQADTPQGREGRVALRRRLAESGPAAVATETLPKLLSPAADPELVARARSAIEASSAPAIDAAIAALIDRPDSTPDLERITCPSLVIVGEQDAITPVADATAMHRSLRRSTLLVIPDAGHLANLENPDAFSRGLADFLLAHP